MGLDKIKAIRDKWKAGANMGEMQDTFPEVPDNHMYALTLGSEGLNLSLQNYRRVLQQLSPSLSPSVNDLNVVRALVKQYAE